MAQIKKPIEPIYRMIGVRIEHLRTTLGLTQLELSKRTHLTRASIANIEGGNQRMLLHDIERFSLALGVNPKHLLRGIWT